MNFPPPFPKLSKLAKSMTCSAFSLFFFISFLFHTSSSSSSNPDFHSLQAFKSSTDQSSESLSSWDPSTDPCSGSWLGVTCHDRRVSRLVLEGLSLSGSIETLALLSHLSLLSLKNNSFSSANLDLLDLSLWRPHLKLLYLSRNRFSGSFPHGILHLRHLHRLDLSSNFFSGQIPPEIGILLPVLLTLRLERNSFGGHIPVSLAAGLSDFNVSCNRLTGEIPFGVSSSFPASSFLGNLGLCGKPLPPDGCTNYYEAAKKKRKWWMMMMMAFLVAILITSFIFTAGAIFLMVKKWRAAKEERGGEDEWGKEEEALVFFEGCKEFVMEDLMRGSAEMLGRGLVGSTYRVVVDGGGGRDGGVVVKRVRKGRLKDCSAAEAESLLRKIGGWRHPNVVSLLAFYSSDDELLLVYDYIPRGSLHNLLHGNRGPGRTPMDWKERLEVALGTAKGLSFLHSASKPPNIFSHQNLSSSNILVDEKSVALVSDFALHQLLSLSPPFSSSSDMVVSPPDTIRRRSSSSRKHDDVYGFGIVLLEILTGRMEEGEGEMDLVAWVQQKVVKEEWSSEELFDIELLSRRNKGTVIEEDEMFALLQVALLCLATVPKSRPAMTVVYKMIQDIKERGGSKRGSPSPSSISQSSFLTSSRC